MTERRSPASRPVRSGTPGSGTKIAATGLSATLVVGLVAAFANAAAPSSEDPTLVEAPIESAVEPSAPTSAHLPNPAVIEISIPMPAPVAAPPSPAAARPRPSVTTTKSVVVPKASPAPSKPKPKKRPTRSKQSG